MTIIKHLLNSGLRIEKVEAKDKSVVIDWEEGEIRVSGDVYEEVEHERNRNMQEVRETADHSQ